MKHIKIKKKLRFNKETIADLHNKEMEAAHGGGEVVPIYLDVLPSKHSWPIRCCDC